MNTFLFSRPSVKSHSLCALALTASALWMPLFGQGVSPVTPPSGWRQHGQMIALEASGSPAANLESWRLAVPRANQSLKTYARVNVYKTAVEMQDGFDYYLVAGSFSHNVTGYGINTVSQGYFGDKMRVDIEGIDASTYPQGSVIDFGPKSTESATTTSFNIGASLGASAGGPNGSVSFGYSVSYATPDVNIYANQLGNNISLEARLPKVGYADGVSPIEAKPASSSSYTMYFGEIFRVLRGHTFKFRLKTYANWRYDYTRGISNHDTFAATDTTYYGGFDSAALVGLNNKCLSVQSGSVTPGTPLILWDCLNVWDQKFTYTPESQLKATRQDGVQVCIDTNGDMNVDGTKLVAKPCSTAITQKFYFDGYGRLRILSGRAVDVKGNISTNGAEIIIWPPHSGANQQWRPVN